MFIECKLWYWKWSKITTIYTFSRTTKKRTK